MQWTPDTLSSGEKRSERELNQSSPSSAEVENEWSCSSLCVLSLRAQGRICCSLAVCLCVGVFRMTGTTNRLYHCLVFVLETLSAACDAELRL